MCDELTAIDEEAALAARGLSRREFAALGAAGVLGAAVADPVLAKDVMVVVEESVPIRPVRAISMRFSSARPRGSIPP